MTTKASGGGPGGHRKRTHPPDAVGVADIVSSASQRQMELLSFHMTRGSADNAAAGHLLASLNGPAGPWAQIGDLLRELLADLHRLPPAISEAIDILAPRGWLIPLDLTPRNMYDLVSVHAAEGAEALEARLVEYFSPDQCRVMINRLRGIPGFEGWWPTLDSAMNAHTRQEFELAIPIWLIAVDGIVSKATGYDPYELQSSGGRQARKLRHALAGSKPPPPRGLGALFLDALLQVLTGLGAGGKNRPAVLNRHAVLHGQLPAIGGVKESIQAILVLAQVGDLLDGRPRADRLPSQHAT